MRESNCRLMVESAIRLLQEQWRPLAVTACLLGIFWGVVVLGLLWAGIGPYEDVWLFRDYFLDRYVAALVLGLVAARWEMIWVAPLGAVASVIVTVGAGNKADESLDWSAYVQAALPWLWIAGLIALGIALSQRIGGIRFIRQVS